MVFKSSYFFQILDDVLQHKKRFFEEKIEATILQKAAYHKVKPLVLQAETLGFIR